MKIMWLLIVFIFVMGSIIFITVLGVVNLILGILLFVLMAYVFGEIYKRIKKES